VLYDDFRTNPEAIIKEIYQFIGVDSSYSPSMNTEFNVSGFVANKKLDNIIGQNSMVKSWITKASPALTRYMSGNKMIKSWVNQMRNKNLKRPPLSKTLKIQINEIYRSEIDKLQNLISKDLSHWQTN
jgi:hypothetical protein